MDGVINFYKDRGDTSFGSVAKVRKILNTKKVGHTGTLDPEAEGVLPICVGKATKLVDFIMGKEKTYKAGFRLGFVSDTLDAFGEVRATDRPVPEESVVREAVSRYLGKQKQLPPMYSALKKDGVRLYELARQGIEIEREMREIEIHAVDILELCGNEGVIRVRCGKGTYIRSLIDDIGQDLGCGAIMTSLVREASGPFDIADSVTAQTLAKDPEKYLIPMDRILEGYEAFTIADEFLKLLVNGVKIRDTRITDQVGESIYRVYTSDGSFLGLGEKKDDTFFLKLNLR